MQKKTKAETTAKQEAKKEEHKNHMITVQRVHECDNGTIMCDVKVNDITIYGCTYKELQYKDESKGSFWKFDFPKRKGNDGKYYNYAFFFVTDDDLSTIDSQIEELINQ